jgi:DNA-binding FadR family transcriptional regulator
MIHRAMLNMMMVTSRMVDLEHTLRFHIPIMEAIEQREPRQASRHMNRASGRRSGADSSHQSRDTGETARRLFFRHASDEKTQMTS